MKSLEEFKTRIAKEEAIIKENEEILYYTDKRLTSMESDGYYQNIYEANLVITTLKWAMEGESNSDDVLIVSNGIYKKVQEKIEALEEGKSIMFLGDKIVDTDEVKESIELLVEDNEDDYHDLPFGCSYDGDGEPLEYKVVGITKGVNSEGKETFQLHIYNWEREEEYELIVKEDFNIDLEIMANIADLL